MSSLPSLRSCPPLQLPQCNSFFLPSPPVPRYSAAATERTTNCATSHLRVPLRRPTHPHVCTVNLVAASLCRSPLLCFRLARRGCSGRCRRFVGAQGYSAVERSMRHKLSWAFSGLRVGIGLRIPSCIDWGIFGGVPNSMLLWRAVMFFHSSAAIGDVHPAPVVATAALLKIFYSYLFSADFFLCSAPAACTATVKCWIAL